MAKGLATRTPRGSAASRVLCSVFRLPKQTEGYGGAGLARTLALPLHPALPTQPAHAFFGTESAATKRCIETPWMLDSMNVVAFGRLARARYLPRLVRVLFFAQDVIVRRGCASWPNHIAG